MNTMETNVDLFSAIHNGIRGLLYHTAGQLQTTRWSNPDDARAALDQLAYALELLHEHAQHEDDLIFPAIERVAPGVSDEAEAQHQQIDAKQAELQQLADHLRQETDPARCRAGVQALNRAFTDFMALYLQHMNTEERSMLALSQERLTPAELLAVRASVQANMTPERYREWLRWMLPAQSLDELVPLFRQVRGHAPALVAEQFMTIGQSALEPTRWEKLLSELAA